LGGLGYWTGQRRGDPFGGRCRVRPSRAVGMSSGKKCKIKPKCIFIRSGRVIGKVENRKKSFELGKKRRKGLRTGWSKPALTKKDHLRNPHS